MNSCIKDKVTDSLAPKLSLTSEFSILSRSQNYDSLIKIKVSYEDADGDLGLNDADTVGPFKWGEPYFFNFFCFYKAKMNGQWVDVKNPFDTTLMINFHERLPRLVQSSRQKSITGTMELFIPARPNGIQLDTVCFMIELVDRALNKSNICKTKEFILKHP